MDIKTIKLLEEKIILVKNIIIQTSEISEETKHKRISELESLEQELNELKKHS